MDNDIKNAKGESKVLSGLGYAMTEDLMVFLFKQYEKTETDPENYNLMILRVAGKPGMYKAPLSHPDHTHGVLLQGAKEIASDPLKHTELDVRLVPITIEEYRLNMDADERDPLSATSEDK